MMDRLEVMKLFVRVAESGSFSKAARAAGTSQPTVSKQVAALERRLGAELVRRSTRGMSLTEAGEDYYRSAVRLLDDFEAAEARVVQGQAAPAGRVRVAMSPSFGRMHVLPRLPEFLRQYPAIAIETEVADHPVNLVEQRVDLAIQVGELADSGLVVRRIGTAEDALVASDRYLATRGEPTTMGELAAHDSVVFVPDGIPEPWHLQTPAGPATFRPNGRIYTGDAESLRTSVLTGAGIAFAPTWLFADELSAGTVKRLLPESVFDRQSIHAVRTGGRLVSNKVKVLTDFLASDFAANPHLRSR